MTKFRRHVTAADSGLGRPQHHGRYPQTSARDNDRTSGQHSVSGARNTRVWLLPALLLAGDLAFVLTHIVLRLAGQLETFPLFAIARDGGYPEFYQYAKEAWVAVAFGILAFRSREYRYLAWSALFGYLLLDDSLGFHEAIGVYVANSLDLSMQLGIRGRDYGEIIAAALLGGTFLLALGVCYWRGSTNFKRVCKHLFGILAIVVFFGVFIDSFHFLYEINWKVTLLMVIVEDGGEMVGMSLAAWYAIRLLQCYGTVDRSLISILSGK